MSDLVRNHIVGFLIMWLTSFLLEMCKKNGRKLCPGYLGHSFHLLITDNTESLLRNKITSSYKF